MSLVIKGGTIVAADRTYVADVLIEGEAITGIGRDLKGDKALDASGCFVMPGGIDPHTHLDMPFMGTTSADNYESGTRAALSGGTTMVVDFCIPGAGQPLMDAFKDWDRRSKGAGCDFSITCASPTGPTQCMRIWPPSSKKASPRSSISWLTKAR